MPQYLVAGLKPRQKGNLVGMPSQMREESFSLQLGSLQQSKSSTSYFYSGRCVLGFFPSVKSNKRTVSSQDEGRGFFYAIISFWSSSNCFFRVNKICLLGTVPFSVTKRMEGGFLHLLLHHYFNSRIL